MKIANNNLFYFLLLIAMIFWGASWVNVKILSNYLNEFETMFFRFAITSVTMIPIIIFLKKSFKIDLRSFTIVILTAIVMIGYMKYFYLGTKLGTASLGGALVTSLVPIMIFLILTILGTKKMSKRDSLALSLGAIGVLTMLNVWSMNIEEIFVLHNLYFIIAAILWSVLTILSSKVSKISPIVFTFYLYIAICIFNLTFFVDLTTIEYEKLDGIFWINMMIISLAASTFANTIYFLGIERLGASAVSSFIFLVPFAAITLSAIFLKETITFSIVIGTILTLTAVKILNNIKILKRKKS
ncbi:MAG: drug/metabolite transporter (DMT)-like permease [Sulfurimonas sp.]|jgi:drug/metabolite transporter (DMT)-like permease